MSLDALTNALTQGEVVGILPNGFLMRWDAEEREPYTEGETLDVVGPSTLTPAERARIGLIIN